MGSVSCATPSASDGRRWGRRHGNLRPHCLARARNGGDPRAPTPSGLHGHGPRKDGSSRSANVSPQGTEWTWIFLVLSRQPFLWTPLSTVRSDTLPPPTTRSRTCSKSHTPPYVPSATARGGA